MLNNTGTTERDSRPLIFKYNEVPITCWCILYWLIFIKQWIRKIFGNFEKYHSNKSVALNQKKLTKKLDYEFYVLATWNLRGWLSMLYNCRVTQTQWKDQSKCVSYSNYSHIFPLNLPDCQICRPFILQHFYCCMDLFFVFFKKIYI